MFQVYVVGLKAAYFLGGLRFISRREYICIYIYIYMWLYSSFFINIHTCNGDKTSQNNRNDSPGSNTRNNKQKWL